MGAKFTTCRVSFASGKAIDPQLCFSRAYIMIMRAGLWVFAGKLGAQIIRFALVIILARLLTPEAFGVVAAVQIIIALSEVVVRFGIGAALIQTKNLTERIEGTALTLVMATSAVICAVLFALREPIAGLLNVPEVAEVLPVTLIAFAVAAATNPATSLIAREMNYRYLAKTEVVSYALGYGVCAVVLAALGYSYWSMIIATVVQNALRAVLIFRYRPVRPVLVFDRDEVVEMIRFGGGVFLAQIMSTLARRTDNALVSSMFGAAALGFYSRAYALMDLTNALLGSVFREVLFSGFSKKKRESNAAEIGTAFLIAHTFAALIILPISALMYLLSDEVVLILLGRQWDMVVPLLQVLALGMYFRLAYKVSSSFNLASGYAYGNAARGLVYFVAVLIFGYIGGQLAGVEGVAWGVLTALACHFALMTQFALKHCALAWKRLLVAIAPVCAAALAGWTIALTVKNLTVGSLGNCFAGAGFLIAYTAVLLLLRNQPVLSLVLQRLRNFTNKLRTGKKERKSNIH